MFELLMNASWSREIRRVPGPFDRVTASGKCARFCLDERGKSSFPIVERTTIKRWRVETKMKIHPKSTSTSTSTRVFQCHRL